MRKLIGPRISDKIRFGNMVFTIVAFIAILAGLDHYDKIVSVLTIVILAVFVLAGIVGMIENVGGPEDLDRPGGRYDPLRRKPRDKIKPLS